MAKKVKRAASNGNEATQDEPAKVIKFRAQAPSGYAEQSTDIVGFWDPEREDEEGFVSPIHFVPLEVKLFDSKLEPQKPSAIVVGKLVEPTILSAPGGEDELVEGKVGDIVGIWYKPGMSAIKKLAGVKVWMVLDGELDTGKINKMKTFDVRSKERGSDLHVSQDGRKQSKHAETAFGGARHDARGNAQHAPAQGDDDVSF
jgi:hypothetical protein